MSENGTDDVLVARPIAAPTGEGGGSPQVVEGTWTVVGDAPDINNDKSGGGERGGEIKALTVLGERARDPNGVDKEPENGATGIFNKPGVSESRGNEENDRVDGDYTNEGKPLSGFGNKGRDKQQDSREGNERSKKDRSVNPGEEMKKILLGYLESGPRDDVRQYLGGVAQQYLEASMRSGEEGVDWIIGNGLREILSSDRSLWNFISEGVTTLKTHGSSQPEDSELALDAAYKWEAALTELEAGGNFTRVDESSFKMALGKVYRQLGVVEGQALTALTPKQLDAIQAYAEDVEAGGQVEEKRSFWMAIMALLMGVVVEGLSGVDKMLNYSLESM